MLPTDFADAPISVVRRSINALVTVAARRRLTYRPPSIY